MSDAARVLTDLGSVMTQETQNAQSAAPQGSPLNSQIAPVATGVAGTPDLKTETKAAPLDDKVSSKLQTLIRREKIALQRESVAKTLEQKIQAREEALNAREAKILEFENLKQTNPRKALELLGLDYQQLTQIELNDGLITPDLQLKKIDEKLEAFKKSQEQKELQQTEAQKQAAEHAEAQAIMDFQREIHSFIAENGKKYELIQFEAQEQLVYDVVNEHYSRTIDPATGIGKILSIEDAAGKVEKFLRAKYEKAQKLESVKSMWQPPVQPKIPFKLESPIPPKSMNNRMAQPQIPKRVVPLTDDERVAKAMAYAKGLRPQS